MRITNHEEIRQMFLRYDKDRNGYITRENILDLFRQINLPLENDLIDAVRERIKFKSKYSIVFFCRYLDDCRMYNQ
jgi:Ca2+-binding EF-hand superfamily protein